MDITTEQVQKLREECKAHIALSDALIRLSSNKDFKLIVDDYLHSEPVRLVQLLGEPSFNMSEKKSMHREEIQEQLIGIARFAEYIRMVHMKASKAEQSLRDLDKAEAEFYSNTGE